MLKVPFLLAGRRFRGEVHQGKQRVLKKLSETLPYDKPFFQTWVINSPYAFDPHPKSFSLRAKDFQTAECFSEFRFRAKIQKASWCVR